MRYCYWNPIHPSATLNIFNSNWDSIRSNTVYMLIFLIDRVLKVIEIWMDRYWNSDFKNDSTLRNTMFAFLASASDPSNSNNPSSADGLDSDLEKMIAIAQLRVLLL